MGATNENIDFCLCVAPNGKELRMKIAGDQIFLDGKCLEEVQVTHEMRTLADEFRHDLARCGQDAAKAQGLRAVFANNLLRMMPKSEGKNEFGFRAFIESGLI